MQQLSKFEQLCSAMATKEGWFAPLPNLPRTNNNPGDLRASPLNRLKDKYGFVQFKTPEEGIAGLYQQMARYAMMGFTIRQVITMYCPPSGPDGNQDTEGYIKEVCTWTGLTDSTVLWDLFPCVNMYTYKESVNG